MKTIAAAALFAAGLTCGAAGLALAQQTLPAPVGERDAKLNGIVDLGKAFPQMKGYMLISRWIVMPPGAGREMHSHMGSPEIVHIVSGAMTVQDKDGAIHVLHAGDSQVNNVEVSHMFLNQGTVPLVVFNASVTKMPDPLPTK